MTASRVFRSNRFGPPGVTERSSGIPPSAYPGRIATSSDLIVAVDRQQTSLLATLNPGDLTMTVLDPSSVGAYNLLSIDAEIVKTTGPAVGNIVPISRGFDGTAAATHQTGALVLGLIDAWHHNALVAEIEAIENALGPNLTNIAASSSIVNPTSPFIFAAQQPGGSLSPGNNVITLAPVPKGIYGTDADHYLYISQGTGTAEAVLINGGTAVAGAASGTVIVNCANSHSGAWTIGTATSGIQEAISDAEKKLTAGSRPVAGGIFLPAGDWPVYAPSTIHNPVSMWGTGLASSCISVMKDGINGIQVKSTNYFVSLKDFRIRYIDGVSGYMTGGNMIQVFAPAIGVIERIRIDNSFVGINLVDTGSMHVASTLIDSASMCIYVSTGTAGTAKAFYGVNLELNGNTATGILLTGLCAGFWLTHSNIGAANGIRLLDQGQNMLLNEIYIANVNIDCDLTQNSVGIEINAATGAASNSAHITGVRITCNQPGSLGLKVVNKTELFVGNSFIFGHDVGVQLTACSGGMYHGNEIGSNAQAVQITVGSNGNMFTGNRIGYASAGYPAATGNITVDGSTQTGNFFASNEFNASASMPLGWTGNWFAAGQIGLPVNSYASAAAFAFGAYPFFFITGTTGITSVSNLVQGQSGQFVTVNGAVTFTAGATIGNTFTTVQNVPVSWFFDGTKLWVH